VTNFWSAVAWFARHGIGDVSLRSLAVRIAVEGRPAPRVRDNGHPDA